MFNSIKLPQNRAASNRPNPVDLSPEIRQNMALSSFHRNTIAIAICAILNIIYAFGESSNVSMKPFLNQVSIVFAIRFFI